MSNQIYRSSHFFGSAQTLLGTALAVLGAVLSTSEASAATTCPGYVPPVTCLDGVTRRPGDILISTVNNGNVRIIGLDPRSSVSNPRTYVHAEVPGSSVGDMVAVPDTPRDFVFTAALNETNGRMTVAKIDKCGQLVDADFGDFSAWYGDFPPVGLGFHHGIAVHPVTGDYYVAGQAFHPSVESGPRQFTHQHFTIPAAGGQAAWWYSWGFDDYGPGDSRNTGGAIFDHYGNYWQSGFGQQSLSVIVGGQPYTQEYRLDYDPQNHGQEGYYGLHDMAVEATNRYIYALDLFFRVMRIDLGTRERTLWYEEDNNRQYMFITIDRFNRTWVTDRQGHVLRLSSTNAPVGRLYAEYDLSSILSGASSIAVYGDNEPQIRQTCR